MENEIKRENKANCFEDYWLVFNRTKATSPLVCAVDMQYRGFLPALGVCDETASSASFNAFALRFESHDVLSGSDYLQRTRL